MVLWIRDADQSAKLQEVILKAQIPCARNREKVPASALCLRKVLYAVVLHPINEYTLSRSAGSPITQAAPVKASRQADDVGGNEPVSCDVHASACTERRRDGERRHQALAKHLKACTQQKKKDLALSS